MGLKINQKLNTGVTATYARIRGGGFTDGDSRKYIAEFNLYISQEARENGAKSLGVFPNITFTIEKDFKGNISEKIYEEAKKHIWTNAEDILE